MRCRIAQLLTTGSEDEETLVDGEESILDAEMPEGLEHILDDGEGTAETPEGLFPAELDSSPDSKKQKRE